MTACFGSGSPTFEFAMKKDKVVPEQNEEVSAVGSYDFAATVKSIADFPIPGVVFRDLSPLWQDAEMSKKAITQMAQDVVLSTGKPDVVVGIESRGFIYGMALALHWNIPFVPFRKSGKLPGQVLRESFQLEYGSAELECQVGAIHRGDRVLVHDDVIATGGTAEAAQKLIEQTGASLVGFSFVIELRDLKGRDRLSAPIFSLITY